jgi:hypothetical protein
MVALWVMVGGAQMDQAALSRELPAAWYRQERGKGGIRPAR